MRIFGYICAVLLFATAMAASYTYVYAKGIQRGGDVMAVRWLSACTKGTTIELGGGMVIYCAPVKKPNATN